MLGLMSLLGLQFNFINVYVGLFLVGVATDYGVYMLQRYLEDPAGFASGAPRPAGGGDGRPDLCVGSAPSPTPTTPACARSATPPPSALP